MSEIVQALQNIGFDWHVALANLVNFLIVFWLLKKFVFEPMKHVMAERRDKIAQGIENAQKAETALMSAETEKKEIIKSARNDSNDIIAKARREEKSIILQASEKAEAHATRILEDAEKRIEAESETAQKELESHAVSLVIDSVREILKEDITPARGEEIIKRVIAQAR